MIKSELKVMETTNEVFNTSLFKGFEPNGEVWEAVRSTVANRLAFDGKSWHETFKKFNSGTYNNQWMVLDYNYFVPGKKPESYLLWVGEQLPRFYQYEDVTDVLVNQGYWASYNVPYFKEVFERSGYKEAVHVNGTWFSYTEAPRAKIFARDQGNLTDMESFMKLMRSNNFKHDPFAFCNCTPPYSASGAIAARRDLNPVDGKGEQVCKPYGAIDAKITNHSMFKRYEFTAVVGPTQGTNDELPVFKWSESAFAKEAPHMLQPDVFNFTPLTFEWKYVEGKRGLDENSENGSVDYNIWEEVFAGDDNNIPID
ncbi:hypothetical protein LSTR_LSTR009540 [Laodelphax striatellus]|uniref:Phospholipase B-like n=1 Tax=Laodelphax striatellus TaxID=195883 RepID=A0A482WSC0_LAOST|nr:hypothetical protein LSTR_LSTR009540 [Laodelphax striatellus]